MKTRATIGMLEELVRQLNETTADFPETSTGKWPGIYHLSRKRFDKSGDLIRERRVPENKSWSIDGYIKQGRPGYTLLLAKNDGVSYLALAGTQDWPKRKLFELVSVYLYGVIAGIRIGHLNEQDDIQKRQEQEDEYMIAAYAEKWREEETNGI